MDSKGNIMESRQTLSKLESWSREVLTKLPKDPYEGVKFDIASLELAREFSRIFQEKANEGLKSDLRLPEDDINREIRRNAIKKPMVSYGYNKKVLALNENSSLIRG